MIKNLIVTILVSISVATSGILAAETNAAAPSDLPPTVERRCKVRSYGALSKSANVEFRGTGLLPDARGQATIRSRDGVVEIKASFKGLDAPDVFGKVYLTYVLWAVGQDGASRSLGELAPGSEAKVEVTSELPLFGLFVTAEPYFAVTHASDLVVLKDNPQGKLAEKLTTSEVGCAWLGKGYYAFNRTDQEIAVLLSPGKKPSLDLLQARNALRIAKLAKADRYASEDFQRAARLTLKAENGRGSDATAASRSAVEAAERARTRAVEMVRQELAEQQRAEAAGRAAAARAETDLSLQGEVLMRQAAEERMKAAEERAKLAESKLQPEAIMEERTRLEAERARLEAERLLMQARIKADKLSLESERAQMKSEIAADLAVQDRSQDEANRAALQEARLQAERAKLEAERVKMQAELEAGRTKNEAERAQGEAKVKAQEAEQTKQRAAMEREARMALEAKLSTEGQTKAVEDPGVRARAEAERQQWEAERRRLEQALESERARMTAERDSMQSALRAERAKMEAERAQGEAKAKAQESEQARLQAGGRSKGEDVARLQAERDEAIQSQLKAERAQMEAERKNHNEALARLSAERSKIEAESTAREQEVARLAAERETSLRAQIETEQAQRGVDRTQFEAQRASEVEKARQEAEGSRIDAIEQDKKAVRARLLQQLTEILNAQDTDRGLTVSLSDVSFARGQYTLVPGAREQLAKIAGILVAHPELKVEAEGHTDSVGTEAVNQALSEKRAANVRDYLVSRGFPSGAIRSRGFGEANPLATNDTPAGRKQNRRVELIISGDPIGPASAR